MNLLSVGAPTTRESSTATFARRSSMIKNKANFASTVQKLKSTIRSTPCFHSLLINRVAEAECMVKAATRYWIFVQHSCSLGIMSRRTRKKSQVQSQVTSAEAKARSLQIAYLREKAKRKTSSSISSRQ